MGKPPSLWYFNLGKFLLQENKPSLVETWEPGNLTETEHDNIATDFTGITENTTEEAEILGMLDIITDDNESTEQTHKHILGHRNLDNDVQITDCSDGESASHHCILCGTIANVVCQRCEDYYCSLECQKQDWPKHRYICFQMPKLVTPQEVAGVPLPEQSPNLTTKGAGEKNHNYKAEIKNSNTNYKSAVPVNNSFSKPVNSKMNYSPQKNDQSVDKHKDTKDDSPSKTSEYPFI